MAMEFGLIGEEDGGKLKLGLFFYLKIGGREVYFTV